MLSALANLPPSLHRAGGAALIAGALVASSGTFASDGHHTAKGSGRIKIVTTAVTSGRTAKPLPHVFYDYRCNGKAYASINPWYTDAHGEAYTPTLHHGSVCTISVRLPAGYRLTPANASPRRVVITGGEVTAVFAFHRVALVAPTAHPAAHPSVAKPPRA